jgi:hypothetical protein
MALRLQLVVLIVEGYLIQVAILESRFTREEKRQAWFAIYPAMNRRKEGMK